MNIANKNPINEIADVWINSVMQETWKIKLACPTKSTIFHSNGSQGELIR